jgi:hypothetical protein
MGDGEGAAAWLLEFEDPGSPGCVLPGMFFACAGGAFGFAPSASGGLRLARREDAEALAEAWARRNPGCGRLVAVEHQWGPA